jgi:hypothetical protein
VDIDNNFEGMLPIVFQCHRAMLNRSVELRRNPSLHSSDESGDVEAVEPFVL